VIPHWLYVHLGLADANSPWYLFPSGWGSILLVSGSFLTVPYITWKRHNCHEPRCWRVGRVTVDDKGTLSCWHHHPKGKPQRGHVREQYHLYLGRRPGRG
jgi:hypothetical protein